MHLRQIRSVQFPHLPNPSPGTWASVHLPRAEIVTVRGHQVFSRDWYTSCCARRLPLGTLAFAHHVSTSTRFSSFFLRSSLCRLHSSIRSGGSSIWTIGIRPSPLSSLCLVIWPRLTCRQSQLDLGHGFGRSVVAWRFLERRGPSTVPSVSCLRLDFLRSPCA